MSLYDRLSEQIAEIPLLDHHCHAPLRLPQAIDLATLRTPFTESVDERVQTHDVAETLGYRAMVRRLAALLGVEPTEEAVLRARAGYDPAAYHRLLADDARLGALYADYLFEEMSSYAPEEWAELTGREVRPVVRIETLAERLIPSHASWESLRQAFAEALAASRSRGAVGFKSIAAYRAGLDIERVDAAAAGAALAAVRAGLEEETPLRLTSKPLIDALIWEAMEVASELGLPIQFHVGLGDDDVFLPRANPTLLRALFQEPRYSGVPIVLLHCYPYVREAAYLSSIYPNAYTDLGLTVPLAGPDCAPLLRAALGLAPTTKVLASTDGHGLPEFQWFAAHLWRDALARVLADLVAEGWLSDADAPRLAAMVLHGNAELIYPA